jgi:polyisoprenyl-phosphate glycosyltransferase
MPAITGIPEYSLIIPVYRNEGSIAELLDAVEGVRDELPGVLEVIFVVDGSPDRSYELLLSGLVGRRFRSRLIVLSRNFGSFAAIRAGLELAHGRFFAVMAADLQEPLSLIVDFFKVLATEPFDVVVGTREARSDSWADRYAAGAFWWLYRRFVQPELPKGGVDVFGCNQVFRDKLLALTETNSSLVGQILWLGYRRKEIPYERLQRRHGRSAWTFSRKFKYLLDSIFSFTDLPIRVLLAMGFFGLLISVGVGLVTAVARLYGLVDVPGYAATVMIVTFFAALNMLGFGIVGSYVWRGFENTKQRPNSIVLEVREFSEVSRK